MVITDSESKTTITLIKWMYPPITMKNDAVRFGQYKKQSFMKLTFISVCIVALVVSVIMACSVGTGIGFMETYKIIIDHIRGVTHPRRSSEWWDDYYVFNNIMPEVVVTVIAGAGLAVAGAVMQSIMNNPLADPYTTGVSSGASLGAVSAIIMGFTYSTISGEMGIVTNAFIGAMVPALIVIMVSKYVGNSPATIILIGTAISYFFNALTTIIMVTADADALQTAYLWQIGSVAGSSWADIPLMLFIVVIVSAVVLASSKSLNVMTLGDKSARSLGLDPEKLRILCLILISFLIASIISYTGIIGFIGLVSPHIARFILGGDNRFVIPGAIVMGSLILTFAGIMSRVLSSYGNVPIGVVMSFVGAPIFLYLVVRDKSKNEIW